MKFYKIIRSANIERSMLKLPGKFEKRFGDKLPKHVTLEVPSGAKWRVSVEKNGDGVWLKGQGWDEFVDCLGLECDDFLMFEFDAMSAVFHVVVMGISASEIKYPTLTTEDHPADDDVDEDVIVLDNGGASALGKKAPSNELESFSGDSSEVEILENETNQAVKKRGYNVCRAQTTFNEEGKIQRVIQGRKVCHHNTDEAEQALARAIDFKAVEPNFIVALQPSYLSRSAELLLPAPFIKEYFNLAMKEAILEMGDKTWFVLYRAYGHVFRFTYGWKKFAEDNCLCTGDVCVFELKKGAVNALKLHIFRTRGEDEFSVSSMIHPS